jgi:peptide deformylase
MKITKKYMENKMNNLSTHQLVYAPHNALDRPVSAFPEDNVDYRHEVREHMIDIMNTHRGIGLAANQINLNGAVLITHVNQEVVAMFNPHIHAVGENRVLIAEGCLSDPGMFLKVQRPDSVSVSWEDEHSVRTETTLHGMDCRCLLHEFDHLQGVMFTDRVGITKLKMARKKQQRRFESATAKLVKAHN